MEIPAAFHDYIYKILEDTDAKHFFESLNQSEISSIRYHPLKSCLIMEEAESQVPWEPLAYYLSQRSNFALDPAWHAGAYYVQESSSMILGHLCKEFLNDKPIKALDLCAAPGGKSTHLLSNLPEGSLLVSNELIPKRNKILIENIEKWAYPNNILTKGEAKDFSFFNEYFDLVVVDAPCSGEGLFRKQPEAMLEWSENQVNQCSLRQKDILSKIQGCVKDGGFLIYSTCTYEISENEEQVERLLDTGAFELIPLKVENYPGVISGFLPGTLRCWTHRVKGSGFFIALLKKIKPSTFQESLISYRRWNWIKSKSNASITPFVAPSALDGLMQSGEYLRYFPAQYQYDLNWIANHLSVTHFGINIGQIKNNIFSPAQGLCYTDLISPEIPYYDTEDTTLALDYLRRNDIPVNRKIANGWAVFRWNKLNLGWMKQNPSRVNNYYPMHLRLRL